MEKQPETLPRLQASRAGYRAHLTQTNKKATSILQKETLTDSDIVSLTRIIEQLSQKKSKLQELDGKIVTLIEDSKELEREIFQTEDIQEEIDELSAQISNSIKQFSSIKLSPNVTTSTTEATLVNLQNTTHSPPATENTSTETSMPTVNEIVQQDNSSSSNTQPQVNPSTTPAVFTPLSQVPIPSSQVSRLPKLQLPTFSGNPLEWLTFWDSFNVAVNSNPSLEGVQKFNYLRAQLTGDAARVIAGFPLTNTNYTHAIGLLKTRFGEPQKIISTHMQALLNLPSPTNELSCLRQFYDSMETHVRGLTSLGKSQESYGDLLVPILLSKLPNELRRNLAREHSNPEWTFPQLREAIYKEIKILEAGLHNSTDNSMPTNLSSSITASFLTQQHSAARKHPNPWSHPQKPKKCVYCKKPHSSNDCKLLTDCTKRWAIVKEEKLCFNCLGHHKSSTCQSKNRCRQCRGKHHTSLCTAEPSKQPPPPPPPSMPKLPASPLPSTLPPSPQLNVITPNNDVHVATTTVSTASNTVTLLKTAVAAVGVQHTYCNANILFDEGAQRSFITRDLVAQLQLQPTGKEVISLSGFGARMTAAEMLESTIVNIKTNRNEEIPLHVLVVENIATPLQLQFHDHISTLPYLRELPLAHPVTNNENFQISVLVGADHYWDIVENQVIRGNGPTAVQSKIGYLLSGPLLIPHSVNNVASFLTLSTPPMQEDDLQRFWSLESMGITPPSNEDTHKEFLADYQRSSITRETSGSYNAGFPWKKEHPPLPSNYSICEGRTRSTARRLSQTPELLKTYGDILTEYENRGFIEKVDAAQSSHNAHYIPHHPVTKESSTTPVRIVFDCSCRQNSNSPSLNDCLDVGPPFLNDLCAIILRFRTYPYGFSTDIEKAFLHVGLPECDRDFTRFFWLSDPTDPESAFQIYRFKVVLFGSTSSPFMLNATLHSHLDNYHSPIAEDIKNDLYVDNFISGRDTEEETLQYYTESRSIMAEGKFNLRSWTSNSKALRDHATRQNVADPNKIVNLLGLKWDPTSDTLTFNQRAILSPSVHFITKREVLRESSKTFDPLGILSPVTIKAKLFLQELWQRNVEWDEPLPPELVTIWVNIAKEIQDVTTIALPRYPFSPQNINPSSTQLHVFADASTKAYGAVAYLSNGTEASLVIAKSRVAPLKKLTLPQLELMAALTGARLANFVQQALKQRYDSLAVKLWTDSEIVLHWLNSNKPLKPFIENRIREIKELFPTAHWNHCPTRNNPADLLTRGISAQQFHTSTLWQHGPEWLPHQSLWPSWNPAQTLSVNIVDVDSSKPTTTNQPLNKALTPPRDTLGIHRIIDVSRYSSLDKLLNVTAYALRFLQIIKRQPTATGRPTIAERRESHCLWVQNTQNTTYYKEIQNIKSKSKARLPLVRQLRLFVDEKDFLRCGGRIHNAPLSEQAKHPYLLPPNHPFTALVVYEAHAKQLHSGTASTVTALRQNFWITSIRQYVKKLLRRCVTCRRLEGTPYNAPDPAPLPKIRMQQTEPFSVTGVDYAGPLYVKENNGETKSYICLFTCAVTRAIHLEVVTDLTEKNFLQAFRRFASRRSLPRLMVSDNASTFIAGAEELKRLFQSPSLKEEFTKRGVEWQFIPKRAPWFGGFWERLIGLSKNALKKSLGRAFITLLELQTLTTEIEGILNDRPITYVSSDIQDDEPLTPSHLLQGRRITSLPYPVIDENELVDPDYGDHSEITRRNKLQAAVLQRFWSRWRHEYLTSLREFHRTSGNNHQTIRVGDIVLVHDEKPRCSWKLAIVESLIQGNDGLVRAANIRTKTGPTNRPITRLYPLEITAKTTEPENQTDSDKKPEQPFVTSDPPTTPNPPRQKRTAALEARKRISTWAQELGPGPECR